MIMIIVKNVVQPPFNSPVMHNSFLYIIAHLWNQRPADTNSLIFFSLSFKWCEFCRVPVYELHIFLFLFLYLYTYVFIRAFKNSLYFNFIIILAFFFILMIFM